MKIGVLVGSLRKGSYNRMLANAVVRRLPEEFEAEFVEIGHLPFYNEEFDTDGNTPKEIQEFREKVKGYDAILLATPEYNRSTAPALKNALDTGSRPPGQSIWAGKPVAVISASLGGIGGFGANHHLRQSISFLDMPIMQQPEVYFGFVRDKFNENGDPVDEDTESFIQLIADSYAKHVKKNLA